MLTPLTFLSRDQGRLYPPPHSEAEYYARFLTVAETLANAPQGQQDLRPGAGVRRWAWPHRFRAQPK